MKINFSIILNLYMTGHTQNIKKKFNHLLIFTDLACGGNLTEIKGNITGPTNLPFNQSSFVCNWKLMPPENMISNNSLTMTIKVTGLLGGPERTNIIRRNCIYPQYIELHGKIKRNINIIFHSRSSATIIMKYI